MQSRDPGIVLIGTANCENAINVRSIKDLVIISPAKQRFIEVSHFTRSINRTYKIVLEKR